MTGWNNIAATGGEARKLEAHAMLAARRGLLILRARRAMLAVLLEHGTATIDDVRRRVPLPEGVNPKVFGPVPSELASAGIVTADGYAKSTRPQSHARPVQVWRLVDRAAALDWLDEHPDRPCPTDDRATPTLFDLAAGHG